MRAQVELTVADELAVRAVFGSGAPAAVGLPGERGAARPLGGGVAFVDPRSAELGCRLILPRATAAKAVGELPVGVSLLVDRTMDPNDPDAEYDPEGQLTGRARIS